MKGAAPPPEVIAWPVRKRATQRPVPCLQGTASANQKKLGAYRSVTVDQAHHRWLNGVPENKKDALIPPGWFDAWQIKLPRTIP